MPEKRFPDWSIVRAVCKILVHYDNVGTPLIHLVRNSSQRQLATLRHARLLEALPSDSCGPDTTGQSTARRPVLSEAKTEETKEAAKESNEDTQQYLDPLRQRKRRQADSTDWFSSQLTRRFG